MKMRFNFRVFLFSLLPLTALGTFILPLIAWFVLPPSAEQVLILSDGVRAISWPFLNDKSEVHLNNSGEALEGEAEGRLLYVGDLSRSFNSYESEQLMADRIKSLAFVSEKLLMDGGGLSDSHPLLYRLLMQEFLRIRDTGWSFKYLRSAEQLEELKPEIKEQVLSVLEDGEGFRTFLLFVHVSGRSFLLDGRVHFSGLPPVGRLRGEEAELYNWVSIYAPEPGSEPLGTIDLDLTIEGRELLGGQDLPEELPLSFKCGTKFTDAWFFAPDVSSGRVDPGMAARLFKSEYRRKVSLFKTGSDEKMYWKLFVPFLKGAVSVPGAGSSGGEDTVYQFEARDSDFYLSGADGPPETFFIKGVNLGTALPGKWFTEFPQDENIYKEWLSSIKDMNLNTIRVYTLMPPAFYRALRYFNLNDQRGPLFLIQEIWPEEHPPENNYLDSDYDAGFRREIGMDIDAVHGAADIPLRPGRAWGRYRSDVSAWTLAFLIGRELEPDEVRDTDFLNSGYTYAGRYISAEAGSPTEAWLARSCDYAAEYETDFYGKARPLGIVNWPTLDPLRHPSEWRDLELNGQAPFNDREQVDIRHFTVSADFYPGFFGAYHIYPNYPDFMNNQESYSGYSDDQGTFRYRGYLEEFIETHSGYPALVAEYGLSTSSSTAHLNPDGYDHGGLPETEQAAGIIRMTEAIRQTGYAGAVIFEWMDEWAKKTWTFEPFMVPYNRHALWHNVMDPEQNYGLMAMESASVRGLVERSADGAAVEIWGDEAYLHIELKGIPEELRSGGRLFLGLDTYARDRGITHFPGVKTGRSEVPSGMEFLVDIGLAGAGPSRLSAAGSYNIGQFGFASSDRGGQEFSPVRILVNRGYLDSNGRSVDPGYTELGLLNHGDFSGQQNRVLITDEGVSIRLPWSLLNVTDPSTGMVLDDPGRYASYPGQDVLSVTESTSLVLYPLFVKSGQVFLDPFPDGIESPWDGWNRPSYRERPKASMEILKAYFGELK